MGVACPTRTFLPNCSLFSFNPVIFNISATTMQHTPNYYNSLSQNGHRQCFLPQFHNLCILLHVFLALSCIVFLFT